MKFFIVFESITICFSSAAFPAPLKTDIDFFLLSRNFWWSVLSEKSRVTKMTTRTLIDHGKKPLVKEWQFLWYNHIARYHAESLRWRKELKVSAAPMLCDLQKLIFNQVTSLGFSYILSIDAVAKHLKKKINDG